MLNDIAGDIIIWPKGDKLLIIKEKFKENGGLPDVIGATDGTGIEVISPKVSTIKHIHGIYYVFLKN